jgi:hypothetical protein
MRDKIGIQGLSILFDEDRLHRHRLSIDMEVASIVLIARVPHAYHNGYGLEATVVGNLIDWQTDNSIDTPEFDGC